jgi:hypothetical protein
MSTQFTGKYVSLTTFRRDGTAVATPVWFVSDNGNLLSGNRWQLVQGEAHNDAMTR